MLGLGDGPVRLLRAVRGIDLVEMAGVEQCCGFGGTFAVKNAEVSSPMLAEKSNAVLNTGAEACTACDNSCLMHIPADRLRSLTGVQILRINTLYQQFADRLAHLPEGDLWLNLPEYMLHRWGGRPVAKYTNAAHTSMVAYGRMAWCEPIFVFAGLSLSCAAPIVPPGTVIGPSAVRSPDFPPLPTFSSSPPACHDTASTIAGIAAHGDDWAYISSGTWSLVGTILDRPLSSPAAAEGNFPSLAGAGGRFCFHRNVNGLWLLRQCMESWARRAAVLRGAPESSTLGNFAVQLATLEDRRSDATGADAERVAAWAGLLTARTHPELSNLSGA